MNVDELKRRAQLVLAVPLVAHLGVWLLDPEEPAAGVGLCVGPVSHNGAGTLHAAATTTLLETAAYLALGCDLAPDEHAVSHALTVTLLGAAGSGEVVRAQGSVDRRTRRLGFLNVLATSDDGRPVARATVVKSIVRWSATTPAGDDGSHARSPIG